MIDRSNVFAKLEGDSRAKTWVRAHLDYPHKDWCLIWPFGHGEGKTVQFGQDHINLPRLMCEYRNGPPPTTKHQAAHSCGRGHEACANPHHLSWKTNSENQVERYQHSGPVKRTRLAPEQVDEIRALKDRMKLFDIARQFNVSEVTIRSIHAGRLWKDTNTAFQRVFSEEEVRAIRADSRKNPAIAEAYGASVAAISRIKLGHTYKWVTP